MSFYPSQMFFSRTRRKRSLFRASQNWGNRPYFPRADKSLPVAEVLGSFLAQFYDDKPVPRQVLLSHDIEERELLEEALSEKSGHRISVQVPQRGEKKDLVDHALTNAREALGRELAESASQKTLLAGLAERFGLADVLARQLSRVSGLGQADAPLPPAIMRPPPAPARSASASRPAR